MTVQLSLPASWAHGLGLVGHDDPAGDLRRLERETVDLKAEIRAMLDAFAARRGIRQKDVTHAMGYVDDALTDLIYEPRGELTREIERRDHRED